MRVLVVEDHAKLAVAIATGLRRQGMAVDVAFDGADALTRTTATGYDVLVLDRDLPRVPGDEVCRTLAAEPARPAMLMLTASGSIDDRVAGLGLGADDYLAKPFAFVELVARIRALARRPAQPLGPVLARGDLRLDTAARIATRAGRELPLRPKELAVLEELLVAGGQPVSASELLRRVWDEMADPLTTTVKATVHRLRTQLGDPPLIDTVPGGYRIIAP
jgi:DNA-binding response OmpR family regulator